MRRFSFLLILFSFFLSCGTDEAEFPELITLDAQQIGVSSAVLEAEIKETGTIKPIRFGFLWGTDAGLNFLTAPNTLDLGATGDKRKFSILLESLNPGTAYYVRSFAADPDYTRIYYGNEITFSTLN